MIPIVCAYNKENMLYDYYYSAKMEIVIRKSNISLHGFYFENTINGEKYTEAIQHGKTPLANYPDLKFVCTEDDRKIIHNRKQV